MPWYVVYRGRKPRVYANRVGCHEHVTGFHNYCYKSFSCKEEAIASYLEFTGQSDVPLVQDGPNVGAHSVLNNMLCLQIIVLVEIMIILGLLVSINSISK
jgi:hypothetical protein